jgi:hypothetical protein
MSEQRPDSPGNISLLESPSFVPSPETIQDIETIFNDEHDRIDRVRDVVLQDTHAVDLLNRAEELRLQLNKGIEEGERATDSLEVEFTKDFDQLQSEGFDHAALEFILEIAYPAAPRIEPLSTNRAVVTLAEQAPARIEQTATNVDQEADTTALASAETMSVPTSLHIEVPNSISNEHPGHAENFHAAKASTESERPSMPSSDQAGVEPDAGTPDLLPEQSETTPLEVDTPEKRRSLFKKAAGSMVDTFHYVAAKWFVTEDLIMSRGMHTEMNVEDTNALRNKNRRNYHIVRGLGLTLAAGAVSYALHHTIDGGSLFATGGPEVDTGTVDVPATPTIEVFGGKDFPLNLEEETLPAATGANTLSSEALAEAFSEPVTGGEELLSSLELPSNLWSDNQSEILQKFGLDSTGDVYVMSDGSLGLNRPAGNEQLSEDFKKYLIGLKG